MTTDDDKKRMRGEAKARRRAAFQAKGGEAGAALAARGIGFSGVSPPAVVSGFSSIDDEIDVRPLMAALADQGYGLALPVIEGRGKPLVMRSWAPGEPLEKKTWGIEEPPASAPEVLPDVVLVPLLAFDPKGYRLGYGGGFYDRTLAKLRAVKPVTAIGIAYDEQRLDAVPRDSYDEPCDFVLTPSGVVRCRG